jgi:hypothetical protein
MDKIVYCTVLYCTVLLPPGVNVIAVNKYIISYHIITDIISYIILNTTLHITNTTFNTRGDREDYRYPTNIILLTALPIILTAHSSHIFKSPHTYNFTQHH